jgi:hypothetical protein
MQGLQVCSLLRQVMSKDGLAESQVRQIFWLPFEEILLIQ